MEDSERRGPDRRQDLETATQLSKALEVRRAFGSDAAERYLALRGIVGEVAQLAIIEANDRRRAERRRGARSN
jgi:hypothetical protein